MSTNATKSVQLTDDEIKAVIQYHARQIAQSADGFDDYIERLRYLNKRLNDKKVEGAFIETKDKEWK